MPDQDEINIIQEFMKVRSTAKFGIITTEDTLEIDKNLLIP